MRSKQRAFTLIELLVVISVIAVLMAILMPALKRAKEQGQRAVCQGSLKNLTLAWMLYADDFDQRIVNGAGGINRSSGSLREDPWVRQGWGNNWNNANVADTGLTEDQKKRAIRDGALWPYASEYGCYKCPTGRRNEFVTYAFVDAMNGLHRDGTYINRGNYILDIGVRIEQTVLWIKKKTEIVSPAGAERIVYIDEGAMTPDSFATHYRTGPWWDDPPVRHGDGTTVSWADGHVSHLKWKSTETIERGRLYANYYGGGGYTPQTEEGLEELRQFRKWVWGRIAN